MNFVNLINIFFQVQPHNLKRIENLVFLFICNKNSVEKKLFHYLEIMS